MNDFKFVDLKVGHTESFQAQITAEMMSMFKDVTGDINPLHCDDNFACENGFKSRVVYGFLTGSFLSTLVGVYLPGKNALFHSADINFTQPVHVEDKILIKGIVEETMETFKQIKIKVTITNQDGKTVLRGKLKVGLRE